jgi:hypothetical protein
VETAHGNKLISFSAISKITKLLSKAGDFAYYRD